MTPQTLGGPGGGHTFVRQTRVILIKPTEQRSPVDSFLFKLEKAVSFIP